MSLVTTGNDDQESASCEEIDHAACLKRTGRKVPLALLLVERGFFDCLDEAQRWVMAGNVLVNEHRLDKPGMPVAYDAILRVRGKARYASRAGYKLEAALAHFAVDVEGCVALDCGASTGGFTDCLLQHGASMVYAVDAGYGQLIGRLRIDARVKSFERTNLSDLTLSMLHVPPVIVTLDLSYLSLTRALPTAAALLAKQGRILALVKPLFEVESSEARRVGRVDNPLMLAHALERVLNAGASCGLTAQGLAKLAFKPRRGTYEFFASFLKGLDAIPWRYDEQELLAIIGQAGIGCAIEK
ncbi:MAG TPA: TlyA family RNA methyltransferase [Ktedonobacteraceae bacterium]|nr:TlyA family RNA methyltransferase [Ktedonobacteraceae bacterium]